MLGDCLHVLGSNIRNCFIMQVLCFCCLEIDVIVLRTAAGNRICMRIQSMGTECLQLVHRQQTLEEVVIHDFDLVDFMRCTETIKEVHNRYGTVNCDQVCNTGQVHTVLNGMRAHHDNTCLTAGINVLMIAEDRQCMCCKRTGSNMNNARQHLTL